jgi:hypothetical protein
MKSGMRLMNWVQVFFFFVHKKIISAVIRVEFASDRISCIILRGRWCDVIALNVDDPTEDKIGDVKDGFYREQKTCIR